MRLRPLAFVAPLVATTLAIVTSAAAPLAAQLPDEGPMPSLAGASAWLNSPPLTRKALTGKVVLVDFWTYSCVNCLRTLPYVKAWAAKYRDQGLVVIGVHAPEFDFEHDSANVRKSLTKLGITYPVAMDNDMKIWNAFHNQYWPAHYFIDAKGRIRHHHFGEGGYDESERVIRQLLEEAKPHVKMTGADTSARVAATGAAAAADSKNSRSPETYLGYGRGERFVSTPRAKHDTAQTYRAPSTLDVNQWALGGPWRITRQYSVATGPATIVYRFHARDVNLVLGSATAKKRVKFHVTIDGKPPAGDAGMDVDAAGNGVITEHRLYQLVRQRGEIRDRTVVITFEGAGAQAYAFTFG